MERQDESVEAVRISNKRIFRLDMGETNLTVFFREVLYCSTVFFFYLIACFVCWALIIIIAFLNSRMKHCAAASVHLQ